MAKNTLGKIQFTLCVPSFPENLKNLDGSQAYGQWTSGILGVLEKQIEDFNNFNERWYLKDMLTD